MTVYPSSSLLLHRTERSGAESGSEVVPAWLLASLLVVFFALVTLSRIEPFHYDGVGRHLAVAAGFVCYVGAWKEVFRRFLT